MNKFKELLLGVLNEFKAFILKGNVIQLAVAVVMGAAFGKLVEAAVKHLIEPLLKKFVGSGYGNSGWINFEYFELGNFLMAVFVFITTAAAVFFLIVKPLNLLFSPRKKDEPDAPTVPPATLEDVVAELKALRAELTRGGAKPVGLDKPVLKATAVASSTPLQPSTPPATPPLP